MEELKKLPVVSGDMPNHIKDYFDNVSKENNFNELIETDIGETELKTDLNLQEIDLISRIHAIDLLIESRLKKPLYFDYMEIYKRHKFSLDRKSREEFVKVNRKDDFEQDLNKFSNFKTLIDAKS